MGKSYRYDRNDDGFGFQSKKQLKRARQEDKRQRRELSRHLERMDGDVSNHESPGTAKSELSSDEWG